MPDHSTLRLIPIEQQHLWDAYITGCPSGHLLQSWGWGELKASAGWHPLRLALWDTQREQIVAAAQVLRRTPRHLPLRVGHLAYIPKGPMLDWSDHEVSGLIQTFFAHLHTNLVQQGALALQAELACEVESPESKFLIPDLHAMNFRRVQSIQPGRTIVLDLTPDEDTLLANMKEKWRYNIRLAGRKGVQVRVAETVEDVEKLVWAITNNEYARSVWHPYSGVLSTRLANLCATKTGSIIASSIQRSALSRHLCRFDG